MFHVDSISLTHHSDRSTKTRETLGDQNPTAFDRKSVNVVRLKTDEKPAHCGNPNIQPPVLGKQNNREISESQFLPVTVTRGNAERRQLDQSMGNGSFYQDDPVWLRSRNFNRVRVSHPNIPTTKITGHQLQIPLANRTKR